MEVSLIVPFQYLKLYNWNLSKMKPLTDKENSQSSDKNESGISFLSHCLPKGILWVNLCVISKQGEYALFLECFSPKIRIQ